MQAIHILHLKKFMNSLLKENLFDDFEARRVEIKTSTTFSISCIINPSFYTSDELAEMDRKYILWKEIKPIIYHIIRGERPPTMMKFVFALPFHKKEMILENVSFPALSKENIEGLFINFQYEQSKLLCTAGISLSVFSLDKQLDTYWEKKVLQFLQKNNMEYELSNL